MQLAQADFEVVERRVTADGAESVRDALIEMSEASPGLIVSTGGPASRPRPDAGGDTARDRARGAGARRGDAARQPARPPVAGIAGVAGGDHLQHTGLAEGCVEQLAAIIDVLPHALRLLHEAPPEH
jgi:hypothetical protein